MANQRQSSTTKTQAYAIKTVVQLYSYQHCVRVCTVLVHTLRASVMSNLTQCVHTYTSYLSN